MAKQKNNYYAINDKIGSIGMPVEGAEPIRSFAEGTGIRKYEKDDPSVIKMRRARAESYQKRGIGIGLAAQTPDSFKRSPSELVLDFQNGRRKSIFVDRLGSLSSVKTIVNKLTGIQLTDEQINIGVKSRITGSCLAYLLLVELRDTELYSVSLRVDGIIKKKHEPTLLRQIKMARRKKEAAKKFVKRVQHKHVNAIRGFEALEEFKKGGRL